MRPKASLSLRRCLTLSSVIAASVVLGACGRVNNSDSGSENNASGAGAKTAGVPWGASAADFQAALKDMPATTLQFQISEASAETATSKQHQDIAKRIEEYSGGKIKVEINYGSSVVPIPDIDLALNDGRLDYAWFAPYYEPKDYPAGNALTEATLTRDATATITGALVTTAALSEVAYNTPNMLEEYKQKGMDLVFPVALAGSAALMCDKPYTSLGDLKGKQVRVPGAAASAEVKALGATPVSLTFAEVYEALQRGIIDCVIGSSSLAATVGWTDQAPFLIETPGAAFPGTPGTVVLGTNVAKLPLPARQLIWDSVFLGQAGEILTDLDVRVPMTLEAIKKNKGAIVQAEPEVSAALNSANEKIKAAWDASPGVGNPNFSKDIATAEGEWKTRVSDLGYKDGGTFADYADWYQKGSLDLKPWLDAMFTQFWSKQRPSS